VASWRNPSGYPLTSPEWLKAHHHAKLPERQRFAERLAARRPKRVIDLGCGTGLWFDLLNGLVPNDCEFIGIELDATAAGIAEARTAEWHRSVTIEQIDIDSELSSIPSGDLTLAFNIFSYLQEPEAVIAEVARKDGALAIRQYDGAALRFGPMTASLRAKIESSLYASVGASDQYRHYDMDRVFSTLATAPFSHQTADFELFTRISPFPPEFLDYYNRMMSWTADLLSDDVATAFRKWLADPAVHERYFFEVDLAAILS
jgi:SAM-dependent methyltransferase